MTKYEGEMGAVGGASRTGREWEGVSRRCSEGLGGGGSNGSNGSGGSNGRGETPMDCTDKTDFDAF